MATRRPGARAAARAACLLLPYYVLYLLGASPAAADLAHASVSGPAVDRVTLKDSGNASRTLAWAELGSPKTPGAYEIQFAAAGEAVLVPHCNGRERIRIDGKEVDPGSKGWRVFDLDAGAAHDVTIQVKASTYEKRIACGEPARIGARVRSSDGLALLRFASPVASKGGGEAVVFVPGGHDRSRPAAVLVGTHPWNGGPWTYAAYRELLEEAGRNDLVLLMPSGLGNSLYVAEAEDEVLRAIEALAAEVAIDRQRVSIWGASMGGAGATTIAFHHPDRFAFVASYFGDSRYDLTTYVKNLLGGEDGARRVNALDVLENGRHLPVLLVHGEDDRTSPMRQSTMLDEAMRKAGFNVELRREPGMGHEGSLVVKHVRDVVRRAASAVAPRRPTRVSFRSVRPTDVEAYGVTLVRGDAERGDAFVDLERRDDGIHVLAANGVLKIVLAPDALGVSRPVPIVPPGGAKTTVEWRP